MSSKNQKWLVITEKPSVAADISKALGGFDKKSEYYESDTYLITWAVGHLVEFLEPEELDPKYKAWLLQDLPILPKTFQYKPKFGQTERLNHISSLAKRAGVVGYINACDAGREGELIFREIYDYCAQEKPFKRLWLQSMTQEAIRQAFVNLRDGRDFDPLGDAARCRAESDWLIGMNGTRALTKRLKTRNTKGVWSIGRVQTPTLALMVKRELEHLEHRPKPYFTIQGQFAAQDHEYLGTWYDIQFKEPDPEAEETHEREDRIFSDKKLKEILAEIEKHKKNASAHETRKESKESAPGLFDLTLLQREANRRFGMSAVRTLQAAQRLYEKHKLLTYPRTDSKHLPEDYPKKVVEIIDEFAGSKTEGASACKRIGKNGLLNKERIFNNKYVSDHFAIIPTGLIPSGKLEGDDARIFELVLKRFIAAFMEPAVWDKVERITTVGSQHFRTRAQDLRVPGWREVYGLDTAGDSKLPMLNTQQQNKETPVKTLNITPEENATKPPSRHSEAKLLALMEHCGKTMEDEDLALAMQGKGIGTPATRADIIENLIAKEYVMRFGKVLKPTSKGIRLIDVLTKIPIEILARVELTGQMEFELKEIEKNKFTRREFMKEIREFTSEVVERAKSFDYDEIYSKEKPLGKCPTCHKGKVIEGFWGYKCTENKVVKASKKKKGEQEQTPPKSICSFIVWKEKNNRYIDRSLMSDLLTQKVVGPVEFPQMAGGGSNEEYLTLIPEKNLVFCSQDGTIKESEKDVQLTILHTENLDNTFFEVPGVVKVNEKFYMCEFSSGSKRKIISRMPKILCSREMSLDEYKTFVQTGSTPPIFDFKSKKGRLFSATLKLKQNGNFEFKFIPKEPKTPKEGEQNQNGSNEVKTSKKTKKVASTLNEKMPKVKTPKAKKTTPKIPKASTKTVSKAKVKK